MKRLVPVPVLVIAGAMLAGSPAAADPATEASLTWRISDCVFSACGASTSAQSVSGNVTRGGDAWEFTGGSGTYDPATGATSVAFTGAITFGRAGAYSITFADPEVNVVAGSGTLSADVSYAVTGSPTVTAFDVRLVDLPTVPNSTSWSSTPPWEPKQFAQPLIDALPPSLNGFFRDTGSGSLNGFKLASPVSVRFSSVAPVVYMPKVTVSGADALRTDRAASVTITGTGFDPSLRSGAVTGLYVVFGPNPATVGYGRQEVFGAAQYLPIAPDANGAFSATLQIKGHYTDGKGTVWNGARDPLGISTWAAHSHATTAWDTWTPLSFAAPAITMRQVSKRAVVVRVLGGSGKILVTKGSRTVKKARLSDGRARVKLPSLKPGKHTLRATYLADGTRSSKVPVRLR